MTTRLFSARFEYLDAIRQFAVESASNAQLTEKEIYNLQLVVDEAASNIIEHAYEENPDGKIEISIIITDDNISVIMKDTGKRFIVEDAQEPDITASLEDRNIGGLGLFFMRKLMDVVRFEWHPEFGNKLTMIKYREKTGKKPRKVKDNYGSLFELGGKILSAATLFDQKDLILSYASTSIQGEITLWLNEAEFRLPDAIGYKNSGQICTELQKKALIDGKTLRRTVNGVNKLIVPIFHEDEDIGVIEVSNNGRKISTKERKLIEGLAQIISVGLFAWKKASLDRWRLEQLGLVRQVSAKIASEPDINELTKKITRLIQSTFKYYYVGILTLEAGHDYLTFRSYTGGDPTESANMDNNGYQIPLGVGLVGSCAQSGIEILVNDVSADERYRYVESLSATKSELVIPLRVEDRILGVLDVQTDQLNGFNVHDAMVLRALADNVAVAIEGANRFGGLHRQANELRVVSEVSKQISSFLSLQEMMRKVAELISVRFNFPYVHLFTVHPTRRQIHYEAGSDPNSSSFEGYILNLDTSEGIVQWVAKNGVSVLTNNVDDEPRYLPSPIPPSNTQSELTVPLIFNGKVNGILDVQSENLNAFSNQDLSIMETLADTIAVAIRNADLFRTEQWRRQTADSLREVAVLLSANASLDQVLHAILTELERNLPSDITTVWLLDDDVIYCAAVHGANSNDLEKARDNFPESMGLLTSALLSRQPIIRKRTDPPGPAAISAGFDLNHSALAVPLKIGDQPLGVLTLAHHTSGRYGHESQAMAITFAGYAAVSIENARLFDSSQEQAYASAALLQVAQTIVSLSDLDEILQTIVRTMPILIGVERAVIFTWDNNIGMFNPAQEYGIPEESRDHLWKSFSQFEFPLLGFAVSDGKMVISQDAHLGPENWLIVNPSPVEEIETALHSDERLLVALPLILKDEAFGVLLIEEAIGGRRFRNRRLEILHGIAQQIALAIQNDIFKKERVSRERLETEVLLARQIQETFIPKTLNPPEGWDLAASWQTALQMGGDFYDIIHQADGRLGIFIADVADKGIPAALFMALTRTLVRAAVLQTSSPAEALRLVNDLLYPDCEQGMFVTAFYGALDPITGIFTYANAGHNPPMWFHDESVDLLSRTGIALGVVENATMAECQFKLDMQDMIVFYTDGITESFSESGEMFGDSKLIEVTKLHVDEKAAAVVKFIEESVNHFIGDQPVSDDITIIVLKRDTKLDI
ncbi:MAG: GAF domain-containing protein [Chloroflexota bacterium]